MRATRGRFYLPKRDWEQAMDLATVEPREAPAHLLARAIGLAREDLIGDDWYSMGGPDELPRVAAGRKFEEGGFVFELSVLGAELFVTAHGLRGGHRDYVYSQNRRLFERPLFDRLPGFVPITELPLGGAS